MKTAGILGAVVLALLGCGAASPGSKAPQDPAVIHSYGVTEIAHKLKNGRTVTCLLWDRDAGYDSGMSCDWANAK